MVMILTVLLVGIPAAACVAFYMLASEVPDSVEGAQAVQTAPYPASAVKRRPVIINSVRSVTE